MNGMNAFCQTSTHWQRFNTDCLDALRKADHGRAENSCAASVRAAETFGDKDERLATSLNNLAALYHDQRKYAAAEPLYYRSINIRIKALGQHHPEVAASLNNLAMLYEDQNKYTEAELLYRRSLAILEKARGPDHPNLATNLSNLAALLRKMGRNAEAAALEQRAAASRARQR